MRPLVAVPGIPIVPGGVTGWRNGAYGVPAPYLEALDRAGADGVVLMPQVLDGVAAAERLSRFDGLLLPGGGDVDPARYGQEPVPEVAHVSAARDGFELPVVLAAVELHLPTLAICRGAQVLNVALGGTLVQHLGDREGLLDHRNAAGDGGLVHPVRIDAGSRLGRALGVEQAECHSYHHQAVDDVAPGLAAVAWADDGVVEAIEPTDPAAGWVVAIQWHAEATAAHDAVQQRLFDAFVDEVAGRRR